MIEDKELGLKVSENKDETFWAKMKENTEERIYNFEREIEIHKVILELCENRLKAKV